MSIRTNIANMGLVAAMSMATLSTTLTAPASAREVDGAHVAIQANWNHGKKGTGVYQAPAGFIIEWAKPVIKSAAGRNSHSVSVNANRRKATLNASARGSGKFWDQKRGWFNGYLRIKLKRAR